MVERKPTEAGWQRVGAVVVRNAERAHERDGRPGIFVDVREAEPEYVVSQFDRWFSSSLPVAVTHFADDPQQRVVGRLAELAQQRVLQGTERRVRRPSSRSARSTDRTATEGPWWPASQHVMAAEVSASGKGSAVGERRCRARPPSPSARA